MLYYISIKQFQMRLLWSWHFQKLYVCHKGDAIGTAQNDHFRTN